MTKKLLLIFILFGIVTYSCETDISDRIHPLETKDLNVQIDTFQVYKKVNIELKTNRHFDFENHKILIRINSSVVVFYGTYAELIKSKIPLPKPDGYSINKSGYLISISIHDTKKKVNYKWAADVTYYLDDKKTNKIKLLYTGNPEESIALVVEK